MKGTEYDIEDIIKKLKTKKLSEITFSEAIYLKIGDDTVIECNKIQQIYSDMYCVFKNHKEGISDILIQYDEKNEKWEIVRHI